MRKKKGVILTEKLDAAFYEKYGVQGEAIGAAKGGRNTLLAVLRARFKRVPREVEKAIQAMSDTIVLESWAAQAATCQSMDEFIEVIK